MTKYHLPMVGATVTKQDIKDIARISVQEMMDSGQIIQGAEMLVKMESLIKEIRSNADFIEFVREEISKHGKAVTTPNGTKLELAEVGTKYDYSNTGDPIVEHLTKQIDELTEALKVRQNFLKNVPISGMDYVDEDGVIYRIYPPAKYSTSSFKSTISK